MSGRHGFAGLLVLDLVIPGSQSLKDKRRPVRSVQARLKSAGFSVSEVAHHDAWQRAQIAISIVARGSGDVERMLDEAERICARPDMDVAVVQRSVLSLEDIS